MGFAALALVGLFACWPVPAAPAPLLDDFSRYPEEGDAAAAWDTGGAGWEVRKGVFESDGLGHTFALPLAASHARRLVVEATVTPRRAASSDWKLAGIAVVRDEGNYWHLAWVEKPDAQGSGHFMEMSEMLDGHWLSHAEGDTKLQVTASAGDAFDWQYNHPYRFRIALSPGGIDGTISELDGTVRAHKAYAFDHRAVTAGRPALTTSSLAAGFDDFRADIQETAPPPAPPVRPAYWVRAMGTFHGKKTGFFHVEQAGGRWWLIDPNGVAFYAVGTDHVNYNAHWCEKLGYAPYNRNVTQKFGSEAKWAESAADRLKQWGFNLLGAGCGESVRYRGLAHTDFLSFGVGFVAVSDIAPRTTWTGFPDVFHPRFAAWCHSLARRRCAPQRDDPWLLGYFLDNELEWFGKNGSETGLVDETFKKPADHPAKQALVAFLRARHPSIAALNKAWGTKIVSWEALAAGTEPVLTTTAAGQRDRRDFVRLIADRYFAATTAAIRKADPNHLILGCRFAGRAPAIWDIAGKYLDIVTVNYYGHVDIERGVTTDMPEALASYYKQSKRPLMITEWSFPALDAGLPCLHGAGQRVATQKEKARCYSIYQKKLFSMPFMVGSDYFMWADEPALGISSTFPEDSNYGLVDVNDDAWPDLTQTAARVNPTACALHGGDTAELSAEILPAGHGAVLRVRNAGKRAARCPVRYWVQGAESTAAMDLPAGAHRDLPLKLDGPAFVSAQVDPDESVVESDRADNACERVIVPAGVRGPAVVVANPSEETLRQVPVSVALGRRGTAWQVEDTAGRPVPAQVDALPSGPELALLVPEVPARSVVLLSLKPGQAPLSKHEAGGDRALSLAGKLRLEHDAGSGALFDRVLLGDTLLGRFTTLVHQSTGQPLWVQPDHVEKVESFEGPVRTVLLATTVLGAPEKSEAKTAVSPEGVYARQAQQPARYRTTFRVTFYPGEQWFGARFVRLENTDCRPWRCESYFFYPLSSIAGKAEDDRPVASGSTPLWTDPAAGLSYGAVLTGTKLRANFWKDTPDGPGEHPDILREIAQDLEPGQAVAAGADDTEVLFFGARAQPNSPGGDTLARLRALTRLQVSLR